MRKIVIYVLVLIASIYISSRLLDSSDSDYLLLKLLISGLVASIVFWFITVWDNQKGTGS